MIHVAINAGIRFSYLRLFLPPQTNIKATNHSHQRMICTLHEKGSKLCSTITSKRAVTLTMLVLVPSVIGLADINIDARRVWRDAQCLEKYYVRRFAA